MSNVCFCTRAALQRWALVAVAIFACSAAPLTPTAAAIPAVVPAARGDAPIVETRDGSLRGIVASGMREYLGIPYAEAPVGPLRWNAPRPHAGWSGTRDATAFGPHCPQPPGPFGVASTTEDCLYLNVFAPAGTRANAHLPVMVWIHGGGFTVGESDGYNPDRLVARGVIVVTLNYRLGRLGFFAQPALDAEHHKRVNYGLLDQQRALEWVRHNIAAFGGEPLRTTIFGESAGGLSVFSQLASPGAAGFFAGAIVESGAYQLQLPTLAASEAQGSAVAAQIGCANQSAACLRALPVAQVIAGEPSLTVPTVDGAILPQTPGTAIASGKFNRVPVIDGSNHDEYRLFTAIDFDLTTGPLTAAGYPLAVAATVGAAAAPKVLAEYPLAKFPSPDLAFATLGTDAIFACPAYGANVSLSTQVPTYAYEFADEAAPEPFLPPVSFPYAAAHASEILFLFDSFTPAPALTATEQRLATAMVSYWTNFARFGTPLGFNAPPWFPYVPYFSNVQSLVPPQPRTVTNFAADHNCAFWASLAQNAASLDSAHAAARTVRSMNGGHPAHP